MPLLRPGELSRPDDLSLHSTRGDLLMSFILKDGSEVADRRLGCIYQPAPDRPRYQIMSLLGGLKPPRSYTWRCSKVLDQGREGACCGFGTAHELIARPAERKGPALSQAQPRPSLTRRVQQQEPALRRLKSSGHISLPVSPKAPERPMAGTLSGSAG